MWQYKLVFNHFKTRLYFDTGQHTSTLRPIQIGFKPEAYFYIPTIFGSFGIVEI
jgi:hypothetical protein